MPGDDAVFRVHQDWIPKTEFRDAAGYLRDLVVWVSARI
jgi:hypothetical protein